MVLRNQLPTSGLHPVSTSSESQLQKKERDGTGRRCEGEDNGEKEGRTEVGGKEEERKKRSSEISESVDG